MIEIGHNAFCEAVRYIVYLSRYRTNEYDGACAFMTELALIFAASCQCPGKIPRLGSKLDAQ